MQASHRLLRRLQLLLGLSSLVCIGLAQAAATDISQTPLLTASGTPVKPNLMFILDDSGSMNLSYLPEDASWGATIYGGSASQCNGLAFNPALAYATPVTAAGASVTDASTDTPMNAYTFTASDRNLITAVGPIASGSLTVKVAGANPQANWYAVGDLVSVYRKATPTVWMLAKVTAWNPVSNNSSLTITVSDASTLTGGNLDGIGTKQPPVIYYSYTGAAPALSYLYSTSGNVDTTTTFYKQCASTLDASPGSTVFTRKVITLSDAALLQKYANWYAFYRTRMLMMKTVVSHAFKDIDDKFRVGYNTILNTTVVETAANKNFVHVRDFDATQKAKFYDGLNAGTPTNYTPLRAALSNAGRYFAKLAPDQTYDPMQYSCQRNFSILATDGAWNTNNESTNYSALPLTGTTLIGNQDGTAARPMRDATVSGTGGSQGSLADVSMYYYDTDLRTATLGNCTGAMGVDVCENTVPALGKDTAEWQHMTTYTLSLGQNGTIKYDAKYDTQPSGDFLNIIQGSRNWPNPTNDASKVDDLWHAAVNGRGVYFNAADPMAVTNGLKAALAAIEQITASGSAAATSTLRPVAGDNQVFIARYTSALWTGDLKSYKINTDTGAPLIRNALGVDIADWSAAQRLKTRVAARKIYYAKGATRRDFTYANLAADGFAADVDNACTRSPALTQCVALSALDKTAANGGINMVSYLRGAELSYYRARSEILGDMVGSSPVFVKASPMSYTDTGYAAFQSSSASRRPVVYVGANDGFLHAFDAGNGDELWAFVPSMVRANLYKLADNSYGSNHQYYVDGPPVTADVAVGGVWKTILVGGLGAGGKGYYALDITNPDDVKVLWEFTEANMGLSFSRPVITKRSNGDWVVVLSSGYNNGGDGKGHLYVLNAVTGAVQENIATTAGDLATPSGLGPVNAWIDAATNNTAKRFYAGDLLGNLWRFDIDNVLGFGTQAVKLATLTLGGKPQPITTRPQLAEVDDRGFKIPAVYVGTGKMMGLSDMTNADPQTIYGIKDPLLATGHGDLRGGTSLIGQTLSTSGGVRTASGNPVDWSTKNGWYVDLPDTRERINIDMVLQFNTLTAASNVPQSVASCTSGGGYAWLYYFNIANGSNTGDHVATKIGDSLVVGLSSFLLANGKNGVIVNKSVKDPSSEILPSNAKPRAKAKRAAWRELIDR